jgi:HEPN domain-containing protein
MFDAEEYRRWMNEAENTFKSAIVDKDHGFHNWSCFKCHQAAEFAIKALLYGLGSTPFGHSLTKMVSDLKKQKINVSLILTSCKKLDLHYIPSRYPNAHPTGSPFEYHDETIAEDALKNARRIIDFVKETKK